MSAGYVHRKASIFLSVAFLLVPFYHLSFWDIQYSIGAIIGVIATPDWDVDNGFIGDQMIRDRIGNWAEKLWKILLYWYRRSLKHGSPLSHLPVLSTIGRILYLSLFFIIMPEIILKYTIMNGLNLAYEFSWWTDFIIKGWKIIIGLMSSDLIHWTLDILTTEHKTKGTRL